MGRKEDLDRFYNEQRLGQRGVSTGSSVNQEAFRKYQSDLKAKRQSDEFWSNLPPPPRVSTYTPPAPIAAPEPVVGPDRFPSFDGTAIEYSSRNRPSAFSRVFSAIWTGIICLSVLIVVMALTRVYYERYGAEALLGVGLLFAVIGLAILAVWCLIRTLKWFLGTGAGRFLIKMVQLAVTVIGVMAAVRFWWGYMNGR